LKNERAKGGEEKNSTVKKMRKSGQRKDFN